MNAPMPSFFIPHGGGPCFFMPDPSGVWDGMRSFLKSLPSRLPATPSAIVVVSGHWETDGFAFTSAALPRLIYDYNNFPPHTYELAYRAPGSPELARKAADLLANTGLTARVDAERGWDHGVFIPLMVAFPEADIPVVEMSVDRTLDPELHLAAGRALEALRREGVLILGSGMSFHNMRGYGDPRFTEPSAAFDRWLTAAVGKERDDRASDLRAWEGAPSGRLSHPKEEHLIPLMVAAGSSREAGTSVYREQVLATMISGFRFR